MKHVQGGPKSCTFLTTISLEPFKIKWCWFYWNFRKISVMKRNYKFLANLLQVFSVKYSSNYCIIVNVICKNMHHLTADDKALILGSRVEKRWKVDSDIWISKQTVKKTNIVLLGAKNWSNWKCCKLSGSGRPHTISQDSIDGAINQWSKRLMMARQPYGT